MKLPYEAQGEAGACEETGLSDIFSILKECQEIAKACEDYSSTIRAGLLGPFPVQAEEDLSKSPMPSGAIRNLRQSLFLLRDQLSMILNHLNQIKNVI